nr:MAG TPA: PROTEIN/DNA Complex catalytic motif, Helix-turn-helix DNA [Caudoviricetes sp.]
MLLNNRDWYIFIRDGEYIVGKLPYALKEGRDIEVLGHATAKPEAYRLLEMLVGYRPLRRHKQGVPVECIDTGERFVNAREACEKYGISQPLMSFHLSGKPCYATCKGLRFKYVDNDTEV